MVADNDGAARGCNDPAGAVEAKLLLEGRAPDDLDGLGIPDGIPLGAGWRVEDDVKEETDFDVDPNASTTSACLRFAF